MSMSNIDMMEAVRMLAAEKGISVETLLQVLADALVSAYKRRPDAADEAEVQIDADTMDIRIIAYDIDEDGNWVNGRDDTPDDLGSHRRADLPPGDEPAHPRGRARAQVRGVRQPRGRHRHRHHPAERQPLHPARPGQGRGAAAPGRAGALRAARARTPASRPTSSRCGARRRAPRSSCRRTHPGLIKRLFELEVPEIADGVVEIKACAREPGHRTKIAVWSNDHNVDPVGACVGARGARVRMVVTELRGEKIDIVPFSEDQADFVAKALSPAKVKEVRIHEDTGVAEVIVPDFQLSLAIGREGQNARLAARLTGWRVDIKSETQLAEEDAGIFRSDERYEARRASSTPRASGSRTPRPASWSGTPPTARRERARSGRPVTRLTSDRPPTATSRLSHGGRQPLRRRPTATSEAPPRTAPRRPRRRSRPTSTPSRTPRTPRRPSESSEQEPADDA